MLTFLDEEIIQVVVWGYFMPQHPLRGPVTHQQQKVPRHHIPCTHSLSLKTFFSKLKKTLNYKPIEGYDTELLNHVIKTHVVLGQDVQ